MCHCGRKPKQGRKQCNRCIERDRRRNRTPKRLAWHRARRQKPKFKAYMRAYEQRPYVKASRTAYDKTLKRYKHHRRVCSVWRKNPKNKKYMREYQRIWMRAWSHTPKGRLNGRVQSHTRNARLKGNGGTWTAHEWMLILIKYKRRCLACGLEEMQLRCLRRILVPDHVIPLSKGGRNDINNLQPLCHGVGGCNNIKNNKHIDYR